MEGPPRPERVVDAAADEQLRSVESAAGDDDHVGVRSLAVASTLDVFRPDGTPVFDQHALGHRLRA